MIKLEGCSLEKPNRKPHKSSTEAKIVIATIEFVE